MLVGRLIEIEKPYFGIDENGNLTYEKDKMVGQCYQVSYANLNQIKYLINMGITIFYYPNPDSVNGLWNHITSETDTLNGGLGSGVPRKYDYRIVAIEIKKTVGFNLN